MEKIIGLIDAPFTPFYANGDHGHGEVRAQDASRWLNVDVNQQNCVPRRAAFFAFENLDKAQIFEKKSSANYLSIEGTWKFHFIKDYNKRPVTCNKLEVIRQE